MGIVSFGATTVNVEAKTLLNPVKGGSVYRQYNANNSDSHRYSYLLRGTTNSGYLPDVTNLQNYRSKGKYHTNKGWDINSPFRNDAPQGDGGLEMTHSVFGSLTYFHEVGGKTYLRISGTAVNPQYFHHTKANQQVAVMTREDGRNNQIKVWKASPINLTSSASFDFGFGNVYGENDWRAVAKVGGRNYGLHVTNDPYPLTAETIDGVHGLSRYYDYGNINLLDNNYRSGINRNQVTKLAGLGIVGGRVTDSPGVTYVMDYTGFVVDIPVTALVSDPKTKHEYEFKIAKTMTTPNGHDARAYVQPLGMPTTKSNSTRVADAGTGMVGNVVFRPVSPSEVTYRPMSDSLRNFKQTSNFVAEEFNRSTLGGRPSTGKVRDRSFSASSSNPRMIGLGANFGKKFGSHMWHELNRASSNVEHVELRHHGRGEVWVGWRAPSIDSNRHVYTTAGIAYSEVPTAKMSYTPMSRTNFKPVVVRHVTVNNGMPQQPFKVETHIREKDVYGFTFKPLDASELRKYGSNLRYTGNVRFGLDRTKPTVYIPSGGRWYSNEFLYSAENGGSNTLYVDIYYEGSYTPPPTDEHGQLLLRERHRLTGTQSNIVGTSVDHRLGVGDSTSISRIRPYGYVYSGTYRVDEYNSSNSLTSSRDLNGTVHTVTNRRADESWTQWAMFYYNLRRYNYEVEHVNARTGNKIEHNVSDYITSTNPNSPTRRTVYPLRGNQLPDGYTYTGRYSVGGSTRNGSSYTIVYDDDSNNLVVRFLYDWNEPEETTKRFQGDDTGSPRPLDTYINAGLQTERDVNGNVVNTSIQANISAVIDTYEAPIAIIPKRTRLSFIQDDGNSLTTTSVSSFSPITLYNNEFLDTLRLDRRIGGSSDANGNQPTRVTVSGGIPMSTGSVSGTEDLQDKALGRSGATVGVNEDRDFVGRWVDSGVTDMRRWTPERASRVLSRDLVYSNINAINRITDVVATYEVDVYNRIKHNYQPRVGSDGLEFYEYTGSDILQGYYRYDSSGNRTGALRPTRVSQSTTLDIDDIGVNEYVDAEGFKVGAGQVAPAQFKVASELFDDGGRTIKGYSSEALPNYGAVDPVVTKEDTSYNVNRNMGDTPRVDYYEEFGYVPFHTEDEVATQQAIPVGGKVTYVNPYEYFLFPTVDRLSVMEGSGNTVSEIRNNVNRFRLEGLFDSDVKFTPEHSGFYMSEVDEIGEFESSIPNVTPDNKNHMRVNVTPVNQYNPVRPYELTTRNYRTYHSLIGGSTSRYTPVDTLQSVDNFNKKLPVTYVYGLSEFLLDDVVAVGKDTGYPVVSQAGTIDSDYVTRYTSDNGVAPSESDKLVTSNNGSIYLIPIHNEGQTVDDVYKTRLFVNQIGISQFNLIDEDEITFEKYLYGRGDNVIYSGEREEVGVDGEFTQDQKVGQNAKPETTTQINGTRTSNNKEVNDKVLDEE